MSSVKQVEFIGYDLGHGETALGRAFGATVREPEILEWRGRRSFVTAVATDKSGIKIGADALNLSALGPKANVAVKFKSRHLDVVSVHEPIKAFTQTLVDGLTTEGTILGPKDSRFIVGCPSGWTAEDREDYRAVFQDAGLSNVRIVPESRAALMTALEQGYLSIEDTRASVLIVDIGSSTTDFVVFDIRLDKADADAILNKPLSALNGYSWQTAFEYALKETIENLGGVVPDTILLTGGASRLPLVLPATQKAFPKARVVRGAEPEFAIARGLAWLGRFEYPKAEKASRDLGQTLAPVLVDAITEGCILPTFRDWRNGQIKSLDDVEAELNERVAEWLASDAAQASLRPVIDVWFAGLQRDIETVTDPLCRDHGLPAMVLSLTDSQHVSRHLEGLSLAMPQIGSMESDTALVGTTLSAILIGSILAHANLFAPLFLNPLGLVLGGALAGGTYIFGRKALSGKMRSSKVPVIARQVLTDGRIRSAVNKRQGDVDFVFTVHIDNNTCF